MNLDDKTKKILDQMLGKNYVILSDISEKCFCLNEYGDFLYNDCFPPTQNKFFSQQKYEMLTPTWVVKFYQYYILYSDKDPNTWYRGEKKANGNIEFDCCADTLEDIIDSL